MRSVFEIRDGAIAEAPEERGSIFVYVSPDDGEKRDLTDRFQIDQHDLDSALDADEVSRLDVSPKGLSIIWKRPKSATLGEGVRLEVSSLGFFLLKDRLIVVCQDSAIPFSAREFREVSSITDVLLRSFLHAIRHYVGHLRVIKQLSNSLESKITQSMENRYLLQMFALSEGLVYYLDAIEANGVVLQRLRNLTERLALRKEQIDLLEDIAIENRQCARQAHIYSTVLSGLMDARGTIVNNNMNVLLKNLTLINVVFLPLNLVASIGGMSEFSMMTEHIDWRLAYGAFSIGMILFGWLTWLLVIRLIERRPGTRRRRFPLPR
jgi:magnesium transporter